MAGKPKKPGEAKEYTLRVRMTDADRELLEQAAAVKRLKLSSWVRSEMVALAQRVLAGKAK